jgi:Thioredoxin
MIGYQASHHHPAVFPLMLLLLASASSAFQPPLLQRSTYSTSRSLPPLSRSRLPVASSSQSSNTAVSVVEELSTKTTAPSETTVLVSSAAASPPNQKIIQTLESVSNFLNYIDHAPRNSLAVVEFYGTNCPMCKRVSLKYKKIAKTYSPYGVMFAEMANHHHAASQNKHIMDVLNIRKFPFLHVYRNGQCVAAHGTESSATFEAIVTDTIERELSMSEQDWDEFLSAFSRHIQQGTDQIHQLRQELLTSQQQEQEQAQGQVQQ